MTFRSALRSALGLALGLLLGSTSWAQAPSPKAYSPAAQALLDRAFADLDSAKPMVDMHVHAIGLGQDRDGTFVNPETFPPSPR